MIPKEQLLRPVLLGITFLVAPKCSAFEARPLSVPQIDVTDHGDMVVVRTWRICGPFVLSKSQDYTWYSPNLESESLSHDYLEPIGGKESPLSLGPPSTDIPINFFNDVKNQVKGEDGVPPPYEPFVDQIQQFPSAEVSSQTLYWNFPKRFSITYSAASLLARTERDVVFVASSNSPLKIWLNGDVISQPPYGSVGHNWSDYYIARVHLHAGANSLLVKMFTFPERNDFSFRIGTRAQVDQFINQNASVHLPSNYSREPIVPLVVICLITIATKPFWLALRIPWLQFCSNTLPMPTNIVLLSLFRMREVSVCRIP